MGIQRFYQMCLVVSSGCPTLCGEFVWHRWDMAALDCTLTRQAKPDSEVILSFVEDLKETEIKALILDLAVPP